ADRSENAGDARAGPGAVRCRSTIAFRFAQVRLDDPVTRIRGVCIPRIAVIGNEGVGDEGVAREQTPTRPRPLQVRVLEADSGVEVGYDEPGAAGRGIPGGHGIDGTRCRGG